MKTVLPVVPLLAAAFAVPSLSAQVDPAMAEAIKEEGLKNSQVMHFLDQLTNGIGHRLTGSENLVKAAYWAAAEFEKMGLSAKVEQWGEWKNGWNRGQWSGRVLAPEPMDLQVATEAWTAGTKGAVRGRLVAKPASEEELAQRGEATFRGAWVFDVDSIPEYEAEGGGRRGGGRRGRQEDPVRERLEELGIAGFVSSSVGDPAHPNRIRVFGRHPTALLDWDRLPTTPQVVVRYDQAKRLAEMLAAGQDVEVEIEVRNRFTPGPIPLFNVVAEIRGSELPNEYVYVSSHLDSWHQATGTTDNGTGTTTTMEAARILAAAGAKPKRTIRFGLWGGEEQGLLGSGEHVRRLHRADMQNVSAVFNHDTGTNWASGLSVTAPMQEVMEAVLAPVMTLTPPDADHEGPVFELRVVEGLRGGGSDHASFLSAGVPAFDWRLSGRSDYFNYTWHSQWDTYDAAIPEYQAHTATVIALTVLGVANLPEKLSRENLVAQGGRGRRGDATQMLESFLGAQFDGLKLKAVTAEGVLAKAGAKEGDVLKTLNGTKLEAPADVFRLAREAGFDNAFELGLDREGAELKVSVKLEMPARRRGRRGGTTTEAATTPLPAAKTEVKKESAGAEKKD